MSLEGGTIKIKNNRRYREHATNGIHSLSSEKKFKLGDIRHETQFVRHEVSISILLPGEDTKPLMNSRYVVTIITLEPDTSSNYTVSHIS